MGTFSKKSPLKVYRATEVFTPSDYPKFTYVERENRQIEQRLRDALNTPGEIVSVSGPSKSGKTVLIENVVGRDNLLTVTGAGITSPDQLWSRVLDWMGAPHSDVEGKGSAKTISGEGGFEGELGVPGVARLKSNAGARVSGEESKTTGRTIERRGMAQVVEEIADSGFVLLIDDFHYMDRSAQTEVAKQIKEAARQHVKICTASVPHRADDVVRGNAELRGRVQAIDLDYWSRSELSSIADVGLPLLNASIDSGTIKKYATEASGSPQLMQATCLQLSFSRGLRETAETKQEITLTSDEYRAVLQDASTRADFSSLIRSMHTGPKLRGTERKEFKLNDGSSGDVYRSVLLAIADTPPRLSFTYNKLFKRLQKVCLAETPQAASIYTACSQMSKIAMDLHPTERVLEWDEDSNVLDIVDPYLLFYMRWSDQIQNLGRSSD